MNFIEAMKTAQGGKHVRRKDILAFVWVFKDPDYDPEDFLGRLKETMLGLGNKHSTHEYDPGLEDILAEDWEVGELPALR